jgi:hypothetical protein
VRQIVEATIGVFDFDVLCDYLDDQEEDRGGVSGTS